MGIIPLLLFSVSCNFDNFIIGVSYGIKDISVRAKENLIIALPTLLGTYLSLSVGHAFFSLLPAHSANILSCLVLFALAAQMIISTKKHKTGAENSAEKYDSDKNGRLDAKEAFMLGLFLAINNIGLGIGFSTSSTDIFLTSLFTCLLSAIGFNIGTKFGKRCFKSLLGGKIEIVSASMIIALGIIELFL